MASTAFSIRDRLVMILERYVSPITVCSMLTTALAQRDPSSREIDVNNVLDVVGEVMIGLRLFCEEDKLPTLMCELADFCDRETQPFHPVPSTRTPEVHKAPVPSTRSHEMDKTPVPSTRSHEAHKTPVPSTRSHEVDKTPVPSTRSHEAHKTPEPSTRTHEAHKTPEPSTRTHDTVRPPPAPSSRTPDFPKTPVPSTRSPRLPDFSKSDYDLSHASSR